MEDRYAKIRGVLARVDQRYGEDLPVRIEPGLDRLHREAADIERDLSAFYGRAVA
jgi:hypothetical protein